MREILFRGKRIDNGEWVYGYAVKGNYKKGQIFIAKSIGIGYFFTGCITADEVISETVGQYTGLIDKNGKKIFEGDICQVVYTDRMCDTDGKHYENEHEMFEEVVFEKGTFCFETTIEDIAFYRPIEFDIYWKQKIKYFEVIGNIHDNPELLEG